MVMFLDQNPGEQLLRLAERLDVAVAVEAALARARTNWSVPHSHRLWRKACVTQDR